jgi:hypothetical protein
MAYTWELDKSEKDFFDGAWKNHENLNECTDDEILKLKKEYISGNTALFQEIVKLINDDRYSKVSLWVRDVNDKKYNVYRVDNSLIVKEYCGDIKTRALSEYTVDYCSTEEIRQVIDYITNAREYIPVNTITMIERKEVMYSNDSD